ncbi:putative exo-beta-1,3-glucanase [Aspergillus campestris IBT 28561]|uniref:Exo-beta-1,3-glucanase n=1 Tax=Aspergillus campestris (strain IBT 28561) TaxID=1392248 RepID=A0A2I1DDF8_ASPC2|nr:putative exo-beta-1,3-glucanase [Aspergillus campestris IBT 28561]PKY07913.1 putative exo-beta-1,3-glucanase [Aspergillus campestris IBT 28561]
MVPCRSWLLTATLLLCSGAQGIEIDERVAGVDYFLPASYIPMTSGIPFTIQDYAAQPWSPHHDAPVTHQTLDTAPSSCKSSNKSSGYWYEHIEHNGQSSFLSAEHKDNYTVFRNVVKDYDADNTGKESASSAIQKAIQDGPVEGPGRSSHKMGTTGQPAIVYLPKGLYLLNEPLQLYVGTVIVGDPTDPPVIKAAKGFSADHLVYGKDPNFGGTINFYIGIKNVVLDSTGMDPKQPVTLLDWTVSQATQLSNVGFNMPTESATHIGLTTKYDYNSNLILNDLWFKGGSIGMKLDGQQWVFRNVKFEGTATGVVAGGTDIVFLGCSFQNGKVGIDAKGTSGSLTVIDSHGSGLGSLITSNDSGNAGNAIILENVQNQGNTVSLNGNAVLHGDVKDTWVHGTLYAQRESHNQRVSGKRVKTARSQPLLSGDKYFTMQPPTYTDYTASEVLNIKSVPGKPVHGDGATDDTWNINSILAQNRNCKIIYFPAGTYIVTDTIVVPAGTRIVGDAFASTISAAGDKFANSRDVRTMVRLGNPGDMGLIHVSDMVFTVADVLPGCKLVEVNIAGHKPGDVGLWNTHFRIGGAVGSHVQTKCHKSPADCKAAWGLLHLTRTSSAYIENVWGWTADHDLDGDNKQTIATGRGLLVEGNSATWLVGTGFEHNALYQYNFAGARNVFSAMQQSESPYWQGPGNALAPAPWDDSVHSTDPKFGQCAPDDAKCRMALFEIIDHARDIFLYGGCNWVFFSNSGDCKGKCQKNAVQVLESSGVYLYGTNTKSTENMVLEGNHAVATENHNAGGWGGVIAAYLHDA